MATIIVAPLTTFAPGAPVVGDLIYGDSDLTIVNTALAQTFTYTTNGSAAYGDAEQIAANGRGGDDRFTVTGVAGSINSIIGDAFMLSGTAQGGDDRISASGAAFFEVLGDAANLFVNSLGGNDRIVLGASDKDNRSFVAGDASSMIGSHGGDDNITIGAHGTAFGDADFLTAAHGGDDRLLGKGTGVTLAGEGQGMGSDSVGGNDHLQATGSNASLYGDADRIMADGSQGGDDYLHCQAAGSLLVGDSESMEDTAKGGNDVLSGSRFADLIVGDGQSMESDTTGGDDVLLGGKGNDTLWGDAQDRTLDAEHAGADRFVFGGASGKDTIGDFQQGKDVIDLQALGYTGFADLHIDEAGDDSIVHLRGKNQVTIVGVIDLTADDFLF